MKKKIVQITAGQGPPECKWVVARLLKQLKNEASSKDFKLTEIERSKGEQNGTLSSVTVLLEGVHLEDFLKSWKGTVQWEGQSPYRKYHKRKNWFVGVDVFDLKKHHEFSERDLRFETFRSSGSGGQHVNKVESAVRVIHIPTGIATVSSATPSQFMNKKTAIEKLKIEFEKRKSERLAENEADQWMAHKQLQRGNPVRTYEGRKFRRRKIKKS